MLRVWSRKMAPPLVTLLSAEPEVQYVALRNINLVVQRWPQILSNEVKVGGCSGVGGGVKVVGWWDDSWLQ
jgi:AP-1 complex subunit beta-1